MTTNIFLPVLFALSFCICQQPYNQSVIELPAQKTRTFVSYGYGFHNNNAIDIAEERIDDCDTDDAYGFKADSTGFYSDNILSCCTEVLELSLKRRFIKAETGIAFPSPVWCIHRQQ